MSDQKEVKVWFIDSSKNGSYIARPYGFKPGMLDKTIEAVPAEDYDAVVKERDELREKLSTSLNSYLALKKGFERQAEEKKEKDAEIRRLNNEKKLLRYHLCKNLPNKEYQEILTLIDKALKGGGNENKCNT